MTSEWHGYPQHPDSHPERPWWRLARRKLDDEDWRRTDGGLCGSVGCPDDAERVAGLDRYDAKHPMSWPPPKCGQVWVWPDAGAEVGPETPWGDFLTQSMVTAFDTKGPMLEGIPAGEWPPEGAVLVAGPHSPWAPAVKP